MRFDIPGSAKYNFIPAVQEVTLLEESLKKTFQRVVGWASWVPRNTYEDISVAVSRLGSNAANPDVNGYNKMVYSLRYLKEHSDGRLVYNRLGKSRFQITEYSDASIAPTPHRKSISGE